jgi:hypothetical protein
MSASVTAIHERPGYIWGWGGRRWLTILLVSAGIAVVAVAWLLSILARVPNLSHLPSESRKALYARTLSDLELCAGPEGRKVTAHCDHQADFILNFEECDGACKALSAKWRHVTPLK